MLNAVRNAAYAPSIPCGGGAQTVVLYVNTVLWNSESERCEYISSRFVNGNSAMLNLATSSLNLRLGGRCVPRPTYQELHICWHTPPSCGECADPSAWCRVGVAQSEALPFATPRLAPL